jgi:sugar O-acyltransferase (sialic acid O-acetyltransferase NeuD family)
MSALLPLLLIGCGGHASDVLSVVDACNEVAPRFSVEGYLDDDPHADDHRLANRGVKRIGYIGEIDRVVGFYVWGLGYPEARSRVAARLQGACEPAEALVHPLTGLSSGVELGRGVVIFGGAHIGPLARIAEGAMVGRGAIIGHDVVLSEYVSVMPGAVVSGDCSIGAAALIGANATVLEGRTVGETSRLGAGAVLTEDLPAGCTAVGVPAKVVSSRR